MTDDNTTAGLRRAIEAIEKKSKGLKPSGVSDSAPADARRQEGFMQAPGNVAGCSETSLEQAPNQQPVKQKQAISSARPHSSSGAASHSVGQSAGNELDAAPRVRNPLQTNHNAWLEGPSRRAESANLGSGNLNRAESEIELIEASDRAMLRRAALNLLAQREQTAFEVKQKLSRRFPDQTPLLDAVIERLQDQGLQNDTRMAEAYVRYRVQRGQGPMKIRSEMSQKGLAGWIIDDAFRSQAPDWVALAGLVLHKRFGDAESNAGIDRKERAKRSRFLQQRGFHYEHISAAL